METAVVCWLSSSLFQFPCGTAPAVPVTRAPPLVKSEAVVPDWPPTKLTPTSAPRAANPEPKTAAHAAASLQIRTHLRIDIHSSDSNWLNRRQTAGGLD